MHHLAVIICSLLFTLATYAQDASPLLAYVTAESGESEGFVITFSIPPTSITLGATSAYAGPADPANALYDSGDGVWRSYIGNTIPVVGEYVAFKGDWRTASGTYQNMFYGTFQDTPYSCSFSGSFEHAATAANAYNSMFRDCNKVVAIHDNPLPLIIGTPAGSMFNYACYGMSGVTGSLPDGFMNTSGLTGAPAGSMFRNACYNMSGVTGSLPEGFMNTSGLTGAPASYMFNSACYNMSGVTGSLPEGFMNTSGLTGAPAFNMFNSACNNMSGVTSLPDGFINTSGLTGAPVFNMFNSACNNMSGVTNSYVFNISSNVTLTANNVKGPISYAFSGMSKWTGTVMWGTNVLFDAITPAESTYTIRNCTQIPGYDGFDANWK